MRVPFNWLKEFTPLSASPEDVAEMLTMRGLEVEALEQITPTFTEVYVGKVVDVEKHPSADRLSLCRVDTGTEVLPIVCGAPNVAKGQKVPVAVPGARLGGSFTIEKRKLRGVESFGMLCSEKELDLSDEESGIFVLPEDVRIGEALGNILEINDHVLEINVPPNRGDCLSVLGIAREAAAAYGLTVTLPAFTLVEQDDIGGSIDLSIADTEACPRYVLRVIRDVSLVMGPYWMRSRIIKCGMRPINAIVDVTNYIMLELGQPLHAFDYDRIGSKRIEVKVADRESSFRTLDGTDRKLEKGDVLICDGNGPVALAGVMGGENSEINPDTKHVALESAFFNPLLIRRTARRLDLRSEASARFERGIDAENVDYCARRAIDLMQRTSGGTILKGSKEVYERKERRLVPLSLSRAEQIIGVPLRDDQIVGTLESIGIRAGGEENGKTVFSVPSYRHDITEYCDLVEEVARIIGYHNIPATIPVSPLLPVNKVKKDEDAVSARDYLTACGFFEIINYAFFSAKDVEKFGITDPDERMNYVPIMNPISKELAVMRTFLAPGVIESLAYNSNRGIKNVRIFETGKVFFDIAGSTLPRETMHLALALSGREREYFWRDSVRDFDFFDLKGIVEGLMERFNLSIRVERTTEPFLDRGTSADIYLDGKKIGWMGEIRSKVLDAYDVKEKVLCGEFDFDVVSEKGTEERTYKSISRYPAVVRDFSFYVDDSLAVGDLVERIREVSPLIVSAGVFDTFKKEVRSVAFRVVFQSYEDTLTDEVVNDLQKIIIDRLTATEGIRLRT
jgi:phenylalanyl-tRNA synthetase beta chain